ncbi:TIGR03086 family protein [Streptomyces albus subsp. chlorinus]|uniref:TIGR03086 family metal-binding protein n=1 Tax=Streptomyces albus TaxID=1888 RepID=UPI00156EF0B2|nr:TIGR03086 family protein [Streptomyces albus subsp. chlorinus]
MNSTPQIPDPRPVYARAAEQVAQLFAATKPEQLDAPTPCSEFTVRDLLGHIVCGARRIAAVGEGGDAEGEDVPGWVSDVPAERWPRLWDEAHARMTAAWSDDARLDAVVAVPWGQMPGRIALAGCVMEAATHTWDLARAIGWDGELDEQVGLFALGAAQQSLPAEGRENMPFEDARQVAPDAGTYTRLAGWLGRDPGWSAPTPK